MNKKITFIIAFVVLFTFFCPIHRAEETEKQYKSYTENFDSTEQDDLSDYWLERNAFGDPITADRIISDPKNSSNKVYELKWDSIGSGSQLLKWLSPLKEYKLSVDLMGGKERPTFTGERSFPAGVYLRTTVDQFGIPEYENAGGEIHFGTAGIFITLNDSWVSIDIKTSDNNYHNDVNKGTNGNWMYFNNKGNNCHSNFTNLNVVDDGNVITITWNNELLCTIEMSEIETIEKGEAAADFYTKAIIKNAAGEVKSTITDARIAAGEYATIAFTVRATSLLVDNLSLEYIEATPSGVEKTPSITETPSPTEDKEITPTPTTTTNENIDNSPTPKGSQSSNSKPGSPIIIFIILGLIVIAAVVFIFIKKRK